MKHYTVSANSCAFNAGQVLSLTAEQAEPRLHALEKGKKEGIYIVLSRVEFKRGEVIGVDGDVNKASLASLEEAGDDAGFDVVKASPAAEKLAEEAGIDLADVTGTGKDGFITKTDVETHLKTLEEAGDDEDGETE